MTTVEPRLHSVQQQIFYSNIKIINIITAPKHRCMSIISSFRLSSSAEGSTSKNLLPTISKYSTKKIQPIS